MPEGYTNYFNHQKVIAINLPVFFIEAKLIGKLCGAPKTEILGKSLLSYYLLRCYLYYGIMGGGGGVKSRKSGS
jgi:hypothetical protein